MVRGNAQHTQVHYKGKNEDFIVFVDDAESVRKWRSDKTVPLAQFVAGWKVFVTHKYVRPSSRYTFMLHQLTIYDLLADMVTKVSLMAPPIS